MSAANRNYGRVTNGDGGQAPELDALDDSDDIITGNVDGSAGEDRIVGEPRPVAHPADSTAKLAHRVALGLSQIAADRPIFTLSVAADLLGLHPRTLRIYEEKGLVVPARTEGNRRRYSQNDIQRFQFIRQLTRSGVNLEGVRIILDMADELAKLGGNPEEVIDKHAQPAHRDEP